MPTILPTPLPLPHHTPHRRAAKIASARRRRPGTPRRLRYVDDAAPGICRRRHANGFRYLAPNGQPVRDTRTLARIRALAIPPAWTDVWICPRPDGHLQATGRDARNRKQYRYHADFRAFRERRKFERLAEFGAALPTLRAAAQRALATPGLTREKVLCIAAVAKRLGNTPAVCRASYVDPHVLAALEAGTWPRRRVSAAPRALAREEREVLTFLQWHGEHS